SLHADDQHLIFSEPLRSGGRLVGVLDLESARQRIAARLEQQGAHVKLTLGERLIHQTGHMPQQRTASGYLEFGEHRLLLEVSLLARPMQRVRITVFGFGLILAAPMSVALALGRRALRRRRAQAAELEEDAARRTQEMDQER